MKRRKAGEDEEEKNRRKRIRRRRRRKRRKRGRRIATDMSEAQEDTNSTIFEEQEKDVADW